TYYRSPTVGSFSTSKASEPTGTCLQPRKRGKKPKQKSSGTAASSPPFRVSPSSSQSRIATVWSMRWRKISDFC
ncbi:unnamed protein product, partial [Symbiodinium sp. CCMP2456]